MAMRMAICWVALVALACAGCTEETCELVPADDGSIVVRCNGSEIPIERCEDDLPDLDGDGAVDDEDCAQREVGRFTREVCEALPAYSRLALCHGRVHHDLGYEVRTAAVGTVFFARWHLVMATSRVTPMGLWAVVLWIDRDDDGRPGAT